MIQILILLIISGLGPLALNAMESYHSEKQKLAATVIGTSTKHLREDWQKTYAECFNTKNIKDAKIAHKILTQQLGYAEINLITEDGVVIPCYERFHPDADRINIYGVGIVMRPTDGLPFAGMYARNNANPNEPIISSFIIGGRNNWLSYRLSPQAFQLGVGGTKDVLTAFRYINKINKRGLPVSYFGLCTSAVSGANAIDILQKNKEAFPEAMVFDSGFKSPKKTVNTFLKAYTFKWNDSAKKLAHISIDALEAALSPWTNIAEKEAGIEHKIDDINCPLFVIHNPGDQITPIEGAKEVYQRAQIAQLWLVDGAKHYHSINHLIQKEAYKEKCEKFFDEYLPPLNEEQHAHRRAIYSNMIQSLQEEQVFSRSPRIKERPEFI